LNLEVFVHTRNFGYGLIRRPAMREALRAGADIVVMVHPDYQYDPSLLPDIIQPIVDKSADLVLGSLFADRLRIGTRHALVGSISRTVFLTWCENVCFRLAAFGISHRIPGVSPAPCSKP